MNRLHKQLSGWFVALIFVLGVLLFPALTSAHAYIVKSTPAENEALTQSPPQVTLQFNEALQPAFHSIEVTDSSGKKVNASDSRISPQQKSVLEADLMPDLPAGVYSIKWSAVSGDGHPIEGTIPFQIGGELGNAASTQVMFTSSYTPGADMIIIRSLFYVSAALIAGILCFYLYLLPAKAESFALSVRGKRLLRGSYAALAVSVLLSLPMQTTIDASVNWMGLWDNTGLLGKMLRLTNFGHVWLVQLALLIVMGILLYEAAHRKLSKHLRIIYTLMLLTALGLLLSKAFTGHSTTAEPIALSILMDFLHLGAASVWLGCLLSIAVILPKDTALPVEPSERKKAYFSVIRRFTYIATVFVVCILISGIYGSLKYVPTWYSLTHTAYGLVLLLKCLLLLIMLGFAAFNMLRGRKAQRTLKAGVWIEFSAGIITLILAAVLTNLPTAMSAPGPVVMKQTIADQQVISLHISPNTVGNNQFTVEVKDRSGKAVEGIQQITLTLTHLDMDMGKYEIVIPGTKGPLYQAKDMISMAGKWNVHVHVLTKSLDSWDTDFKVTTGNP